MITLHGIPNCDTVKKARAWLDFNAVGYRFRDFKKDPPSAAELANWADAAGWELQDGSGLSRTDLVTARGISALLAFMHRHPHGAAFRDSLPVAGVDGTLKSRLSGPRTAGRIQAKTGRIRQACALAGYAAPRRGEPVAFAIFVNHATAPGGEVQDAIDGIVSAILGP